MRVETRLVRILRCDNRGSDTPIVRIFDDFSMVYDDVHSLHPRSTPCLEPIRGSVGAPRRGRASGERGSIRFGNGPPAGEVASPTADGVRCTDPDIPVPGFDRTSDSAAPGGLSVLFDATRRRPPPARVLAVVPAPGPVPHLPAGLRLRRMPKGGPGIRIGAWAGSWDFAVRRSRTRRRVEGCERLRRGRAGGSAPLFGSFGVEVRWSGAESEVFRSRAPRTSPHLGSPECTGSVQYRAMAPKSSSTNQSPSRGSNLTKPFAASRVSSRRKVRSVTLP